MQDGYRLKATCQETAWVPLWNDTTRELYGDLPPGVFCHNVTGATCLVLRMTVTAFQVEIGKVNIADSTGTFAERRKLGISPAISGEG